MRYEVFLRDGHRIEVDNEMFEGILEASRKRMQYIEFVNHEVKKVVIYLNKIVFIKEV